jgi:tetratricopeptide (TPR) repeat protein/cell division septation protein DedD
MNTSIRAGWVVALLLLARAASLTAQVSDEQMRADKQFDLYAYNLALKSYEQVLQKEPRNSHVLARLGDCNFQLNRPEEALGWYDRAAQQSDARPDVQRRYAVALMHTGDYVGARKWFRLYSESNFREGQYLADMCDFAISAAKRDPLYTVRNEPANSSASDYSPTFLGQRMVYNSSRTDLKRKNTGKNGTDYSGSAFNQLFVTQRNPETGYLQKPAFLKTDIQNVYNEGPLSYSADGRKVAFCRNNFIDGTRQVADKGISMSLYLADVSEDGNWENERPFPYNASDFSTGFPNLSANGKTLVFAANDPNGFGGWDLYVTNLTASGWSQPRNLGGAVNTEGNEITPFYDGKYLYFSSDWHKGLGGMDVFRANLGEETISGVTHLGPGINSSRDDYGFVYDENRNLGYLTSNRDGGQGNEDIWQAVLRNAPKKDEVASNTNNEPAEYDRSKNKSTTSTASSQPDELGRYYLFISDENGSAIPDVRLDFTDCALGVARTDKAGKFYFTPLDEGRACNVMATKDGYRDVMLSIKNFTNRNALLTLSSDGLKPFDGYVLDIKTKAPVSGVDVQVQLATNKIVERKTDADGAYNLSLIPGETYFVTYSKKGYLNEIVRTVPGKGNIPTVQLTKNAADPVIDNEITLPTEHKRNKMNGGSTVISPKENEAVQAESTFNGYSIQLAASPTKLADAKLKKMEPLTKEGNIYAKEDDGMYKYRLGIFDNKADAEKALKKVKATHKDAFVVPEYGQDPNLVMGRDDLGPQEYSSSVASRGKENATPAESIYYAVQVASLASNRAFSLGEYNAISSLGSLYSKPENGLNKLRLGVWTRHGDAEAAQKEVVARGFQDAIIVTEKSSDQSLQGFIHTEFALPVSELPQSVETEKHMGNGGLEPKGGTDELAPIEHSRGKNGSSKAQPAGIYFVRLASLSNPNAFDPRRVENLDGTLEKRPTESGSVVLLLSGFADKDAAISAQAKAAENGFPESYVVKESKGKLVRVQ